LNRHRTLAPSLRIDLRPMAASLPGEARESASKYCRPQHSLQNPSALILSTRLSRTELFRRKEHQPDSKGSDPA
jgi:hypothetical protein